MLLSLQVTKKKTPPAGQLKWMETIWMVRTLALQAPPIYLEMKKTKNCEAVTIALSFKFIRLTRGSKYEVKLACSSSPNV